MLVQTKPGSDAENDSQHHGAMRLRALQLLDDLLSRRPVCPNSPIATRSPESSTTNSSTSSSTHATAPSAGAEPLEIPTRWPQPVTIRIELRDGKPTPG